MWKLSLPLECELEKRDGVCERERRYHSAWKREWVEWVSEIGWYKYSEKRVWVGGIEP